MLWLLSMGGLGLSYWRKQRRFIGEIKANIAELATKNAEISAKNAELEQKNFELDRFTYTVSHDL